MLSVFQIYLLNFHLSKICNYSSGTDSKHSHTALDSVKKNTTEFPKRFQRTRYNCTLNFLSEERTSKDLDLCLLLQGLKIVTDYNIIQVPDRCIFFKAHVYFYFTII